jgi:hypothetical protein
MSECVIEGCNRQVLARGWCVTHYGRWKRNGDPEAPRRGRWDGHEKRYNICSVDGCETKVYKATMCGKHRQRLSRHGDPTIVLPRASNSRPLADRLWEKVTRKGPGDCWDWTGTVNEWGYGHIRFGGRTVGAHRAAFFVANGHWPEPVCRHSCDNPKCCNPAHLLEGSVADNNHDMVQRGRDRHPTGAEHGTKTSPSSVRRGTANSAAKLTEAEVRAIRSARAAGVERQVLAEQYGLNESTVYNIVTRRSWKHVT